MLSFIMNRPSKDKAMSHTHAKGRESLQKGLNTTSGAEVKSIFRSVRTRRLCHHVVFAQHQLLRQQGFNSQHLVGQYIFRGMAALSLTRAGNCSHCSYEIFSSDF